MPDLRIAAEFYGALLGWEFTEVPDGHDHYLVATLQRLPVACLVQPAEGDFDVQWTVYLETRDAVATTDAAVDLGATVLIPPVGVVDWGRLAERLPDETIRAMPWYFPASDLAELATMAVLADPAGCSVGVWHWRGGGVGGHPGAPGYLVGAEHLSLDPQVSAGFYRAVPGWEDADQEGVEFHRAPNGLADRAPLWVPRFGVADLDGAAQCAVDRGGTRASQAGLETGSALIAGPWGEPSVLVAAQPG